MAYCSGVMPAACHRGVTVTPVPFFSGLLPLSGRGPEKNGQFGGDDGLELAVGAGAGVAVGAPPAEGGGVAEAVALHVVVGDLDHQLGAQQLEREVLARVPAAHA